MPKQSVNINFSQGLNTKTDPWQLPIGQFSNLENSVFQKGGLLQKRNGYGALTTLNNSNSYLTTFNGDLTSIGKTVSAYSSSLNEWVTKGNLQPCSLNVLPLIRNNVNQTQSDCAIANGLVCTVFTQTNSTTSGLNTQYMYAVADVVTGQNIIQPSAIPALAGGTISGSSRVYVVGGYFVIVSPALITATNYLQYSSIPITNPVNVITNASNISAAQNINANSYAPISSNPGWDAIAINSSSDNTLVIAYNTISGGQAINVTTLTQFQIVLNQSSTIIKNFAGATNIGSIVSICFDATSNPNIFYVSFWNNSNSNVYTCAVYIGFGSITQQFAPTLSLSTVVISNLASAAKNGSCQVLAEVTNAYSYDSNLPSNYISSVPVSSAGVVGASFTVIRSVGIASKAFVALGNIYILCAYSSTYQPSYFLVNCSVSTSAAPVIVAKLAYENGGGYITTGLPNVTVNGNVAQLTYLYKDLVQALNTLSNSQQTTAGGIYSQTGINLVNFTLGTASINSVETGNNLHISGGFLSQYDGYLPVEHNFFVWPDNIEVTYNATSTVTPTGTFSLGSNTITVSSATGISVGMSVADTTNPTYIPANTYVVYISGTTVTISNATTHAGVADALSIQGNIAAVPTGASGAGSGNYYYQAVYSWTDNQGIPYYSAPSIPVTFTTTGTAATGSVTINVPTLRLTMKTANPVKIIIYRWSLNTQAYNQVTSITAPLLNNTTVDSVSFVDNLSDANIVGNSLIYTTGGVVEDVNAPSSSIMTLFDTRLWLVDAENPNVLWVSKQVIEGTPVEMSDLFKIYVAPSIGTTGSTGPITALAPMDDKIIIFKKNAIYYINGIGPNNLGQTAVGCSLGNYSQPTFIASVVGCTNQQSIVLIKEGLLFQSDKGIWLLDRNLQTLYIGAAVENFNSYTVTSAQIIPGANRVLFTLNTKTMLMYDYYYQQWGTFTGINAISSTIYNNLHTVIDSFGNILQETPGVYMDLANPVLIKFTTSWMNLASLQGYERFYSFLLLAKFISPHSLQFLIAYDYNSSAVSSVTITPQNFSDSTPSPYGVPVPFGAPKNVEQWKIDSKIQLCESFQLTINEVFNSAYGTSPGAGFTMSGINCIVGVKAGNYPIANVYTSGAR